MDRPRLQIALVLAIAVVVRGLSLYCDSRLPMFRSLWLDSEIYDEAGKIIAAGDWTLGHDVLHMSPAYCYVVGLVYSAFGSGPWPIRLVQLLFGLVTVSCVQASATLLYGRRWGLVAGLAAALYGPFIFYDSQVLADGLATTLSAAFLWLLLRARAAGTAPLRGWIALGVSWGLAVVTRPNALLLFGPLVLCVYKAEGPRHQRPRALLAAGLAGLVTILPVTLRNFVMAGEPVLVTDSGGMNLYIGNSPDAVGTFHTPPGIPLADKPRDQFVTYKRVAEEAAGRPLSSREVDSFWFAKTGRYVSEHTSAWLALMGEKLWLFWSAREVPNSEDYAFVRTLQPVLGLPLVQFGWIAPFALLGTGLLFVRRKPGEILVALTNVVFCAANVGVFILARYRVSAVPGLLVAAAGCLGWLESEVRARRWGRLTAVVAASIPLLILVWWPKLPAAPQRQYLQLGNTYAGLQDYAHAKEAYERSVAYDARSLMAQRNLAWVSDLVGDHAESQLHWHEVARLAVEKKRDDYAQEAATHLDLAARP